jgi:hypothetical protein
MREEELAAPNMAELEVAKHIKNNKKEPLRQRLHEGKGCLN